MMQALRGTGVMLVVRVVKPPAKGVWRIGRADDPLPLVLPEPMQADNSRLGHRFDSVTGSYGVLYFSTTHEGSFGEALAVFRPDPALDFTDDDYDGRSFMKRGQVPADWRSRRLAVRVKLDTDLPFVDIESADTLAFLSKQPDIRAALRLYGHRDLDIGTVRGPDRRVTRTISEWECWAVFGDTDMTEQIRQPILRASEGLARVEELWDLRVF